MCWTRRSRGDTDLSSRVPPRPRTRGSAAAHCRQDPEQRPHGGLDVHVAEKRRPLCAGVGQPLQRGGTSPSTRRQHRQIVGPGGALVVALAHHGNAARPSSEWPSRTAQHPRAARSSTSVRGAARRDELRAGRREFSRAIRVSARSMCAWANAGIGCEHVLELVGGFVQPSREVQDASDAGSG